MSKNIVETVGPQMTLQYGAYALRAVLARLYAHMRMHTPTRPRTHMHARKCNHARTDQSVIVIAFPPQQWFRFLMLRYTYVACLVLILNSALMLHFKGSCRYRPIYTLIVYVIFVQTMTL